MWIIQRKADGKYFASSRDSNYREGGWKDKIEGVAPIKQIHYINDTLWGFWRQALENEAREKLGISRNDYWKEREKVKALADTLASERHYAEWWPQYYELFEVSYHLMPPNVDARGVLVKR